VEIAKFVLTAIGTFLSVFGLIFSIIQQWRKKQDEKFELFKKTVEVNIQKEANSRKDAVAHIEGRITTLENTMSQRFENRLSIIEGELKGIKPILLSIQGWFINNTPSGRKG